MSALVRTSTFALLKPDGDDWGGDSATFTQQGAAVGGTLSAVQGYPDGSGNVVYQQKLTLDPCPLIENWRVRDLSTGQEYGVVTVDRRTSLIPCVVAQVSLSVSSS